MIFETIKSEGLAHLSYLIGDDSAGVCAVIDPRRDVEVYLERTRVHQARITHILETHIHADFVSGSRELAAHTGAPIHAGASEEYRFDYEPLHDGDTLELGAITLEVLHTPGHSPEHVSFVARGGGAGAEENWAVFTGDTLFAGEIGRPDLAEGDTEAQARRLHASLHDKLLALDDGVEIYPAHGKGSPCGSSIGERDRTTIGYERRHNAKLQTADAEIFARQVHEELSPEPFYYTRMKRVNAEGPPVLGVWPYLTPLAPKNFREAMQPENTVVVDTREIIAFGGAHIDGALNIALRSLFPVWAGWTLRPDQQLLLVTERVEDVETVQRHLLRIGLEKVVGYLQGGMRAWAEAGLPLAQMSLMSVHELQPHTTSKDGALQVLDVRRDDEWKAGHIPTAQHIYAPFLTDRLDTLDRDRPVAVYCGSGYRASLAASTLQRNGFEKVYNVPGSMDAWTAADYPLERS